MNIIEKDKEYVWHPFSPLKEKYEVLPVESAQGVNLVLEDGTTIIDAVSSWWTNIHGHGNVELLSVIQEQALKLDHVIFAGFTHKPAVELSEKLIEATNYIFKRVFFSDNGSTAVEVGIKLALQFWGNKDIERKRIITLDGAYHGDTFGSMSLAGKSEFFKAFNDKLFDVTTLDFPTEENISDVLNTLEAEMQKGDVACLVVEPLLQGSAGMRMYSEEILMKLFQIVKKYDGLIVSDEVLTGFGRTGKLFASLNGEFKPDIIALSKGLTGGILPLGLTLANKKIESAFNSEDKSLAFYHGHSFTGNPITCALALKSLEITTSEACIQNRNRINEQHKKAKQKLENYNKVKTCRVLGTVFALEIEVGSGTSYFNELRDVIYQKAISKKILLRPLGNVVYIIPPYVISNDELDLVYQAIKEILDEI